MQLSRDNKISRSNINSVNILLITNELFFDRLLICAE